MKKENPDFFKIKDKSLIRKILDVTHQHEVVYTVWLKNQTVKFETTTFKFDATQAQFILRLPAELSRDRLLSALEKQGSNEILGSFQVDGANFFFRASCDVRNLSSIFLEIPTSVFRLQRRANLRILFDRAAAPAVEMVDPTKSISATRGLLQEDFMACRLLDLSAGGMAIAVPVEFKETFKPGLVLHETRFTIRDTNIEVATCVVRHVAPSINDKKIPILKVGVQFTSIRPQHEQAIVQFALEESRKLFSLLY
jgi:hypothetical protein